MEHNRRVILCALLIVLGVPGCGAQRLNLKMEQIPQLSGGSPLSAIPSVAFGVRDFQDARPIEFAAVLPGAEWRIEPTPTQIVVQALEKELLRNGHTVVRSGNFATVDVIIEGTVTQFLTSARSSGVAIARETVVEARIATIPARAPNEIAMKAYRGTDQERTYGLRDLENNLSNAVSGLVKEFTTDPEFLERLKGVKNMK